MTSYNESLPVSEPVRTLQMPGKVREITPELVMVFNNNLMAAISSGNKYRVDEIWNGSVPLKMRTGERYSYDRDLLIYIPLLVGMNNTACQSEADASKSFTLYEACIRKLDECKTTKEAFLSIINASYRFCALVAERKGFKKKSMTAEEIEKYINRHIQYKITAEDISEELCISKRQIFRIFQTEIGMPLSKYVNNEKLRRAAALLRTGDYTSSEVSSYLGFASQSYFTRLFTTEYGQTPATYGRM